MAEMESGEKELRKAFEETTTRNVTANVEFTNNTRKLVQEMVVKISRLEALVIEHEKQMSALRMQLSTLQAKVYAGGT